MSNNNQNNNHSWKNRLDELEAIPGEPLPDKKMAWEKLQARIEDKPKSKKKFWYWAAAAAILCMCMLPWMITEKKPDALVEQKPVQQTSLITATVAGSANIKQDKPETNSLSIKINTAKIIPAANVIQQSPVVENKKELAGKEPVKQIEPVITFVKSIPDTIKTNITSIIPKKKLPVIHINELGNNNNQFTANSSDNNSFRRFIRPSNKDMSVEHATNSKYNGDHIIIRNINPQNQD